ncbi:hypothetical protein KVR01_012804 [Diaporthe batatas]|uniref:uncharacterized protein n=1 Tax=Diaporthe batatas TaxID=748121 RepID=UPI001D041304|nr:uncharacterized protein KVR01_012804 [Diaporthe batatas]KAG8157420.1 hypothetical protein KVR01_012804 [Diaporthe batatas]
MKVLMTRNYDEYKFAYWLMGYDSSKAVSHGAKLYDRQGVVELLYFHGTENDPNVQYPVDDNDVDKPYGYLCFSVDNLQAACPRITSAGYQCKLLQDSSNAYGLAVDPDGYQVKLIEQRATTETRAGMTDPSTYRLV